jgi:hypothetical protein
VTRWPAVQVVVIAQGIGVEKIGRKGMNLVSTLQDFLKATCDRDRDVPAPAPGESNAWFYPKGSAAKATHEIRVVHSMTELAAALDMEDAFVVYEGHSRYGQGPAFGPEGVGLVPDKAIFPNPWGVHFRMGYDATSTECVGDILLHSLTPTEFDLTTADPKGFLPEGLVTAATNVQAQQKAIKKRKLQAKDTCARQGAWRSMDVCLPTLAAKSTARGETPLTGRHFYEHSPRSNPEEFNTSVTVGSDDLDKATLACRLFFVSACSSKVHFHAALARRRKVVKSGCQFLLALKDFGTSHSTAFLKQVLLKGRDPTTKDGMRRIVKALNDVASSGIVGVY